MTMITFIVPKENERTVTAMAEYIEREALEIELNHRLNFLMAEYGEYDHYTSGFDGAVTMVENFPAADVELVQEWIPVTERLPEAGRYVVCIAKRNPFSRFMPMIARIEKNGWVNPITEHYISEATHWMPLPLAPEVKND